MRQRIAGLFAAHGIADGRVEMRGHSPHPRMLAEYGDIDFALDPFPFNGGLTTCEALWMGVPVLCLEGSSMISRQGAALLHAAAMNEWVMPDEAAFVSRAKECSSRISQSADERLEMRARLAGTKLLDPQAFAAQFAAAVKQALTYAPGAKS
jgi:predicted O-linked N-acetylglucosamine transferase (SPINDLY family)